MQSKFSSGGIGCMEPADILGSRIEVVTDIVWEFLKRDLDPLGMEDTAFYVPADKQDRFANL